MARFDRAKEHERQIVNLMNSCRHYHGLIGPGMVHYKRCDAGIEYETVRVSGDGRGNKFPCWDNTLPCSSSSYPSREEAEAAKTESDRKSAIFIAKVTEGRRFALIAINR